MLSIHRRIPARALCAGFLMLLLLTLPMRAWAAELEVVRIPATGCKQVKEGAVTIDISNLSQGYVMCSYNGSADKIAIQVKKAGSDTVYTYYTPVNGDYEAIPLTEGSGRYYVQVWERLSGYSYTHAAKTVVDVVLEDELLPFLYSSHIIRFRENSLSVEKGRELAEHAGGDAETIAAVHAFIVENIRYDHEKVETLPAGYIANPDDVLISGKGICVDYAALMAAMLRSLGIPIQVVYGRTTDGMYHCWVRVYSGDAGRVGNVELQPGRWTLLDPTFAANVLNKSSWVPDTSGYEAVYTY